MNGAAAETATKIFSRKRSLPLVLFLLLLFLLPLSNAAGQSANAAHATAPLDFIVHSMETAQAAVQLPSRVRREYSLGPPMEMPIPTRWLMSTWFLPEPTLSNERPVALAWNK